MPLWGFEHKGKGYNTREGLRANSLAVNLVFSRVCGLHEDKISSLILYMEDIFYQHIKVFWYPEHKFGRGSTVPTFYPADSFSAVSDSSEALNGVTIHEGVSNPIGKVDLLELYSLNFRKFLYAVACVQSKSC